MKEQEEMIGRTNQFALRTMKLVGALPKAIQGRAIGGQLMQSGTPVAANYRAACRARSKAEFIAKLGTVEEEADESAFWLEQAGCSPRRKFVHSFLKPANESP
jgi:four helix bundle protein